MNPVFTIQKAVSNEIAGLNLTYVLAGAVVPPEDVANQSGFLPVLFEQQQILAGLIGVPEKFQPKAFGTVIDDETALLNKTLQVSSETAVVPLISYLTDAARMTKRLAIDNTVDLGKLLNPEPGTPHFLSVILDELVNPPEVATTQQPDPDTESESFEP